MMTLMSGRRPTGPETLSAIDLAQLRVAGRHFDGVDRAPELRFVTIPPPRNEETIDEVAEDGDDDDDDEWDDGNLAAHMLSVWEVHVDGEHRYDVWIHHGDNGTLFAAGTTEPLAGRVQSTWMTPDLMADSPYAEELDAAMHAVGVW